jgi:hypothetical protein
MRGCHASQGPSRHGKRLRLQQQPFQLLALLLERPGELVTREELSSRLWPHTEDFDYRLGEIREALGAKPVAAATPLRMFASSRPSSLAVVPAGQPATVANDLAPLGDSGLHDRADAGKSPRRPTARAWGLFGLGLALASLSWILSPGAGIPRPQFAPWRS